MGDMAELAREQEIVDFDYYFDGSPSKSNKFIRHRKTHSAQWMRIDGEVIKIKNMTLPHIRNAMELLIIAEQTELRAYKGLLKEFLRREENGNL